jgi:hypothetical protein
MPKSGSSTVAACGAAVLETGDVVVAAIEPDVIRQRRIPGA